jgi:hypothetical protein
VSDDVIIPAYVPTPMKLELRRRWLSDKSTIGELWIDGEFECFTLEDVYRAPGQAFVPGATCIPCGLYDVAITHSPKFGIDMPLVLNVPGRRGIRFHWGNKPEDTDGCVLVGKHRVIDQILESRAAYEAFFQRLMAAKGPISVLVTLDQGDFC